MNQPNLITTIQEHHNTITGIKYISENEFLTCSLDKNVILWNSHKIKEESITRFSKHTDGLTDVDCSNNGELVFTSSTKGTVYIWVRSEQTNVQFLAHLKAVTSINLSSDAKQFLTSSKDTKLKIWDTELQKCRISFAGHTAAINCARYSPDNELIASNGEDKKIQIWDRRSGISAHTITLPRVAQKIAFHPDQELIAVAMTSGSVRIYDYKACKLLQHYTLHHSVSCISWHHTGSYLLTSGTEGLIKIVDLIKGKPEYVLQNIDESITSISYSPKGNYFACGTGSGTVKIWESGHQNENIDPSSTNM